MPLLPFLVMTSVMPKGVEHKLTHLEYDTDGTVMTSVMPKGVEHPCPMLPSTRAMAVMTSVMPKGVEHPLSRYGLAQPRS